MKKIIGSFVIVAVLIVVAVFLAIDNELMAEIPSRLARYHNTGEISVTIDNEKIELDDCEITYNSEAPGEPLETEHIKKGKFKFKKGMYGGNIFSFNIPGYEQLTVKFGDFNTNWWHVNDYDVDVNIVLNDDFTLSATVKQIVYTEKRLLFEREETYNLRADEEAVLSVYQGP